MLDRLDQIIDTMGNDPESTDQPSTPDTQSSTETQPSTEEPASTETPGVEQSTQPQSTEAPNEDTSASQEPAAQPSATEPPKQEGNSRNKNKYTHEEQVAYAFNKLNSKFSRTKRDLANALREIEALKKANAAKPPVTESKALGPEAFSSQEDYLKYIANQSIIEQLQKAAEQKRNADAQSQAIKESQDRYTTRAQQIYNTPEAIEEYNTVVGRAINEEGLGDALANDPVISDFINTSELAPRLVYHFAAIPEDFERISAIKDPTDKRFALNMLQHKIQSVFANQSKSKQTTTQPAETQPTNPSVPIVGKAGTGGASAAGTTELSMDDVMSNLRSHKF